MLAEIYARFTEGFDTADYEFERDAEVARDGAVRPAASSG
jgi:hypothetical protein